MTFHRIRQSPLEMTFLIQILRKETERLDGLLLEEKKLGFEVLDIKDLIKKEGFLSVKASDFNVKKARLEALNNSDYSIRTRMRAYNTLIDKYTQILNGKTRGRYSGMKNSVTCDLTLAMKVS